MYVSGRLWGGITEQRFAWLHRKLIVRVYDVEEPPGLSSPDAQDPRSVSWELCNSYLTSCHFVFNDEDEHAGEEKKI